MRSQFRLRPLAALLLLLASASHGAAPPAKPEASAKEISDVAAWQAKRLERLTSETGWLTLVGLYWLAPGEQRFGTAASNEIVLPAGTAPAVAGTFRLDAGKVSLRAEADAGITIDGAVVTTRELTSDEAGAPDEIRVGRLRMTVIRRGERYGIRVKDPQSPVRTGFRGLTSYPVRDAYRIDAEFVPYDKPREVKIATVLGTTEAMAAPGVIRFPLGGKTITLLPVLEEPDAKELFFIFRDRTSGKETYEAGRFVYTDLPKDGRVTIDFNRAYNPPCAFTKYATCPLPPRENWLDIAIEAGEKKYR